MGRGRKLSEGGPGGQEGRANRDTPAWTVRTAQTAQTPTRPARPARVGSGRPHGTGSGPPGGGVRLWDLDPAIQNAACVEGARAGCAPGGAVCQRPRATDGAAAGRASAPSGGPRHRPPQRRGTGKRLAAAGARVQRTTRRAQRPAPSVPPPAPSVPPPAPNVHPGAQPHHPAPGMQRRAARDNPRARVTAAAALAGCLARPCRQPRHRTYTPDRAAQTFACAGLRRWACA